MALSDLFKKFKDNKEEDLSVDDPILNLHTNSRILLVDGMNLALRAFNACNTHNFSGNHVGLITGALSSLGSVIKQYNPTKVIVTFDGASGSRNRKYLFNGYKAKRTGNKITNTKVYSTVEEQEGSKSEQLSRFIMYLRSLPLTLMAFDTLEADDVISVLTDHIYTNISDARVCIFSGDADFMQLVNDRIIVYNPNPGHKKFYTVEGVLSNYKIHPENFGLIKALCGDTSDEIPGCSGLGIPTALKLFEGLDQPKRLYLDDIYKMCESPKKKSVLYQRVLYIKHTLESFYKIVNLREVNVSNSDRKEIIRLFEKKVLPLNKSSFLELWQEDRLHDAIRNVEKWLDLFAPLGRYKNL